VTGMPTADAAAYAVASAVAANWHCTSRTVQAPSRVGVIDSGHCTANGRAGVLPIYTRTATTVAGV
jgi:hypothetical protein